MSKLKFKTRRNTPPQGKPKVYFCCHPNDFKKNFEIISDEILAKQNCSIWYKENSNIEHREDFLSDLLQMQLFVMPVTTALLCTPNDAIDIEFKFAMENHIPVLPLMQEEGLDEVFNKKCGDLQFLDKNNQDSTAISYDEKLDKYLSSVLIGDELAEKIRAAFDAYVFLSYRKKDRKYAQELMKLIHKNDFCRDIAIWYDEFLTPGENFNDAIKDALRKSGLFVLTVTPNLVNEVNYIMTTEYPMAKKEGKPILPMEIVYTNKNLLIEQYKDFPECIDVYDEENFSHILSDNIKRIAIKENNESAEHNFFIGLAYLSGIDVETDHEKAVSLITSSAEKGLFAAIDKLAEMYQTGLGVEINYNKSIEWREKKIELLLSQYNNKNTVDNLHQLFLETQNCADIYIFIGNRAQAMAKYLQSLHYLKETKYITVDTIYSDLNVCYRELSRLSYNLKTSLYYYVKFLSNSIFIANNSNKKDAQNYLLNTYITLGDLCCSELTVDEIAQEAYKKAVDICKTMTGDEFSLEIKSKLAYCYSHLKHCFSKDTDEKFLIKAITIQKTVLDETDSLADMRQLAFYIPPFEFATKVSYANLAPNLKPETKPSEMLILENSLWVFT